MEKALKGFQCSSCGAPLEVKEGAKNVKCNYCGITIRIPQESSDSVNEASNPLDTKAIEKYEREEREKTERTIVLTVIFAGIIILVIVRAILARPSSPPAPELYILTTLAPQAIFSVFC